MTPNKFTIFFISIIAIGYFSYHASINLSGGDFSVFYCTAKIVIDPSTPSSRVYDISSLLSYNITEAITLESRKVLHFIFSLPAAYLLSPLALLPYFYSKALIIFVDILCYVIAFRLLLKKTSPDKYSTKPPNYFFSAFLVAFSLRD